VPRKDLLASVLLDVHAALGALEASPVYGVLNACRTLAYVREGLILSKQEGGLWALAAVPDAVRPAVRAALDAYATRGEDARFPPGALQAFSRWMSQTLPPGGVSGSVLAGSGCQHNGPPAWLDPTPVARCGFPTLR
jgi:hypothetical protein